MNFGGSSRSEHAILSTHKFPAGASQQQVKEKKSHEAAWKKEGELIRSIQKVQAELSHEISCIIGTAPDTEVTLEESEL